jgi:outer membrane protein assembly factor BamB
MAYGNFATCIQRWDAQTLKMTWSAAPPDSPAGSGGSPDGVLPLFSADSLYLSEGSTVWAFALASGEARVALADAGQTFRLLAVHGNDLIVSARSQRGTTKYAIWAVNAASGDTHWTFDLGQNPPIDYGGIIDDAQPMWLAQPAADGLRVIRFKSASDNKSYAILQDTLNWDSGDSAGQKSTPLNLDTIILSAPEWIIWNNDSMWMVMNYQLLAFDVAQRKMVYQWP